MDRFGKLSMPVRKNFHGFRFSKADRDLENLGKREM